MSPSEQVLSLRRAGQHEQARTLAVSLAGQFPGDAELQYQAVCVHDFLGRESEAIPFYLAALAGQLPAEHLRSAHLGLGSTFRALGLARFPDAAELKVFLAMELHNLGQSKQAVELLLGVLAQS
jgi:hypothetical protein